MVRLYFGLNGKHPMTLEEIGELLTLREKEFVRLKKKQLKD
ncbi:hypothetical protein [Chryseobacterium indoltheticum]